MKHFAVSTIDTVKGIFKITGHWQKYPQKTMYTAIKSCQLMAVISSFKTA